MSLLTKPRTRKLMSADEFWDFCIQPENDGKSFELIRGELVEMPRPTRIHGIVQVEVSHQLRKWLEQVPIGYVATESGLMMLGEVESVVGPDVAFYTDAKTMADVPRKWGSVPPVLAVEILSPNERQSTMNAKIADYLHSGVRIVWLIDYEERRLTVYHPDRSLYVLEESAELTDEALPGFRITVADLFKFPPEIVSSPSS